MEKNAQTQKSLTDPEAKLMKFKTGYEVGYNIQTATNAKHHLIADYQVSDKPSDHGPLYNAAQEVKEKHPDEILNAIADKGYRDREDMVRCLESGIIPNVHLADKEEYFILETPYEPVKVSEVQINSVKAEDLKTCLRAGVIPKVYEKVISNVEVVEIEVAVGPAFAPVEFEGVESMVAYARAGFFVRDLKSNCVFCPLGEKLRFCGSRSGGDCLKTQI